MTREIILSYNKSKNLIENADILLFRSPVSMFSFGYWIGQLTLNKYSHIAIAYIDNNEVYCIEFKEFHGSRIFPLKKYIEEQDKIVDVYRMPRVLEIPYLSAPPVTNGFKPKIRIEKLEFDLDVKDKIIAEGKEIANQCLSYGWMNIWKIGLKMFPFIRLFIRKNGVETRPKRFVCSTLVSFLYRKYFIDIVQFIDDSVVSPADISNSGLIQYLFTITNE